MNENGDESMKVVKAHKFTFITLAVIVVILIVALILLKTLLPDYKKGYYGNRLNELEKHQISNDTINRVKSELESKEGIEKVSYHAEGRLINLEVTVSKDLDLGKAKESVNDLLTIFTEEELAYYDLQVFLITTEESEGYPTIGYKHKTSAAFVWAA